MKYLIIEKTRIGYKIKIDDGAAIHYVGYTARNAEQAHRARYNSKYKHFTRIYI